MSTSSFTLSIDVAFRSHIKVRKFVRLMGDHQAWSYLIGLWSWAVAAAPTGDLTGIDTQEIEDGAGWAAMDGKCFNAMVAAGFVDSDDSGVRIHNWNEPGRTGYAIQAAEKARERWRKSKGIPRDSARNPRGVHESSTRNPRGIHAESTGSPSGTSAETDFPRGIHAESTRNPPGVSEDSQVANGGSERSSRASHGSRFTVLDPPVVPQEKSEPAEPDPWTVHGLTSLLRVAVEKRHSAVVFWTGGTFAARNLGELLGKIPEESRTPEATRLMLRRIDAFAAMTDEKARKESWSARLFCDRFGSLGVVPETATGSRLHPQAARALARYQAASDVVDHDTGEAIP